MRLSTFFLLLVILMFSSCKTEKTPKELFEQQQSGVCMVLNSFYYELELPNGTTFYCSGIDDDGELEDFTLEKDEIMANRANATGTAFFIDNKGTLMTNRHVVNPTASDEAIKKGLSSLLKTVKEFLQYTQLEYAQQFEDLEEEKSNCYQIDIFGDLSVDYSRLYEIEEKQKELASNFSEAQDAVDGVSKMDVSKIKVRPVSEIGIAYNDTHVTKYEDFLDKNPCVVTKVSEDEDVDLALIQLKNKTTPADKYIFMIKGRDVMDQSLGDKVMAMFRDKSDESLQIGQDLIMIGFNAGLILGNTKQGIQAQMTSGTVSQNPDHKQILYSSPRLPGSTGSPVNDTDGYVRAVNFAKLRGTDSFNFGIPDTQIVKFLND